MLCSNNILSQKSFLQSIGLVYKTSYTEIKISNQSKNSVLSFFFQNENFFRNVSIICNVTFNVSFIQDISAWIKILFSEVSIFECWSCLSLCDLQVLNSRRLIMSSPQTKTKQPSFIQRPKLKNSSQLVQDFSFTV